MSEEANTLMGDNEAATRLKKTLNQTNKGGIEYSQPTPSPTGHEQYTESKSKRNKED
jgi:hypothetical protein